MRILFVSAALVGAFLGLSTPANAGNCNYSWQSASDGSSCGDRAASRRAGGN